MAEAAAAAPAKEIPAGASKVSDGSILFITKGSLNVFQKIKKRPAKFKYAIYSIDADINLVKVYAKGKKRATLDDLCTKLDENNHTCHYVVYEHEYKTDDGRTEDTLYFLTWVPPASSSKSRILYVSQKKELDKLFTGTASFQAATTSELRKEFCDDDSDDSSDWDPDA